ncbi:MAG: hypothetical protein CBD18_00945 [Opitutales bacterium TMED158]|nr:MAG: hypothetical protein CBD18_00945 [Opitutales bacterium TMED158]
MPITDWGWEITADELNAWILEDDNDVTLINKPALVVCHPSKKGPWSSLAGACREGLGHERSHLVARLDRETSGIILFAKHRLSARHLQMALEQRKVAKKYVAILEGEMAEPTLVDAALGKAIDSLVYSKAGVRDSGRRQEAQTQFNPLHCANGYTLVEVTPLTGRKHQIRVHAAHIGHAIAGDKLYGPDETLFLDFIENGWTEALASRLPLNRQALHAYRMTFDLEKGSRGFVAPLAEDMVGFCQTRLALPRQELLKLLAPL